KVDPAPPGTAIATPIPEKRGMKKYDIPDLAGAQQALGSQLLDGHLLRPLIDYLIRDGGVEQRISIFEGGLVVINMSGGAIIRKRRLTPLDALNGYTKATTVANLRAIDPTFLAMPEPSLRSQLRVYD